MPVPIYKPLGKTPYECVSQYKTSMSLGSDTVVSYAGRLDPMAEGLLLLLVGREENAARRRYEHLSKEYEVQVVLGISTDSGDLMGKPTSESKVYKVYQVVKSKVEIAEVLSQYRGTFRQRYHPYSSRLVQGKPLYWWAKRGRLGEIQIPDHEVTISSLECLRTGTLEVADLIDTVAQVVGKVRGDFRQGEIILDWQQMPSVQLQYFTSRVACGKGGTYMRVLAEDIGRDLGTCGMVTGLKRTRVGAYQLTDALQLF